MTKEDLLKIIFSYEKELRDDRDEMTEHFGHTDKDTQRCWTQWMVIDELLSRLELNEINEEEKC